MRRRTLLASLAASSSLLAGCNGRNPTETDPGTATETVTDSRSTSTSPTSSTSDEVVDFPQERTWTSIVDLDTIGRTYALSPVRYNAASSGVEVRMRFDRTATAAHPARLVASIRNTGEYPESLDGYRYPPFGGPGSDPPQRAHVAPRNADHSDEQRLVLAPTVDHDLVDGPPAVERDGGGGWRLAGEVDRWLPETITLDAGEAVRGEYAVVGHPQGSERPRGMYDLGRVDGDPVRISVWETDAPGPTTESRFVGESVPALERWEDDPGVAWFHEADEFTTAYVRPETERTDLPGGITFQFVNHSRERMGCGGWYLHKLHDGEWFDLGPFGGSGVCRIVPPSETESWTLHAYRGGGDLPPEDGRAYPYLGGGRYAVVASYSDGSGDSGAVIDLTGDPIEIAPTDGVEHERDGGTARVTSPHWSGDDGERDATVSVTHADAAEETLIREQVMPDRYVLRNTLPFFEAGVEEVLLRSNERVAASLIRDEESSHRYRVGGQAYEVATSGGA